MVEDRQHDTRSPRIVQLNYQRTASCHRDPESVGIKSGDWPQTERNFSGKLDSQRWIWKIKHWSKKEPHRAVMIHMILTGHERHWSSRRGSVFRNQTTGVNELRWASAPRPGGVSPAGRHGCAQYKPEKGDWLFKHFRDPGNHTNTGCNGERVRLADHFSHINLCRGSHRNTQVFASIKDHLQLM